VDQPISSLAEEDESDSLFVQLTSSLSMGEMFALIQGNFSAITGINQKLKTVLLKKMGGDDSAEKRKEVI
jgi:hypothetical protein